MQFPIRLQEVQELSQTRIDRTKSILEAYIRIVANCVEIPAFC